MAEVEAPERDRRSLRPALTVATTIAAGLVVWITLVVPNDTRDMGVAGFARIPVEAPLIVAVALLLKPRPRRTVAVLFGVVLGFVMILKALDLGFFMVFDRPFDILNDWYYIGPGLGVLGDSVNKAGVVAVVVAVAVVIITVLTLMPLAVVRLTRLVEHHRDTSTRVATALGVAWVLCAVLGMQYAASAHVASSGASGVVYDQVGRLRADLKDRKVFAEMIAADPLRDTPQDQLLTGLRGKDVMLVFVESYGRVAIEGSDFSPRIADLLDEGTTRLDAAGFSSKSAFLTSPTFGAGSWLAHSTLQSGVWVDSQQRYNQLVTKERITLTDLFGRAGWRTVFNDPAITKDWSDGASFYHFDKLYDARNVGYRGPKFGYASMPDQYTLSTFQRLELAKSERPNVMAEIDLVSSHHPWTPLPSMVDWSDVGDGSIYRRMSEQGASAHVSGTPDEVRTAYGRSIEYSLESLISFVQTNPDPDLVMIVLGDHQPHRYVTGDGPGHDVPISVIAHDPAVMDRISSWGWEDGMRPSHGAPVWKMDTFRDRFVTSFGPQG
jgi:hypothetical protein